MFAGGVPRTLPMQDPFLLPPGMAFVPGLMPMTGAIPPMAMLEPSLAQFAPPVPMPMPVPMAPAPPPVSSTAGLLPLLPPEEVTPCPALEPPDWQQATLPPFPKNLYSPSNRVQNRSASEVERYLHIKGLEAFGEDLPRPCQAFEDLECLPEVLLGTVRQDHRTLDPLAGLFWPVALTGRDTVVVGTHGLRAPLAYVVPVLQHITAQPHLQPDDGPIALLVCPSREAAEAGHEICGRYGRPCGIKSAVPQGNAIARGVEVVVGTPGRLCDLLAAKALNLGRTTLVVLDEADRLVTAGYADHVKLLLRFVRPDRQTLLFAGAVTPFVKELCAGCPAVVEIRVGTPDRIADVRQHWHFVNSVEQSRKRTVSLVLNDILDRRQKAVVYCAHKAQADELTFQFRQHGYPALVIPEEQDVEQRRWVLNEFALGNSPLLVSDDFSMQQLEIPGLALAVSYQLPVTMDQYFQRLRRLCRPDGAGDLINLFGPQDVRLAPAMVRFLGECQQPIPPQLMEFAAQAAPAKGSLAGPAAAAPASVGDRMREPILRTAPFTPDRFAGMALPPATVYPPLAEEPTIDRTGPIVYEPKDKPGSRAGRETSGGRDRRERGRDERDDRDGRGVKRGRSSEGDRDRRRGGERDGRGRGHDDDRDRRPRSRDKWDRRGGSRREPSSDRGKRDARQSRSGGRDRSKERRRGGSRDAARRGASRERGREPRRARSRGRGMGPEGSVERVREPGLLGASPSERRKSPPLQAIVAPAEPPGDAVPDPLANGVPDVGRSISPRHGDPDLQLSIPDPLAADPLAVDPLAVDPLAADPLEEDPAALEERLRSRILDRLGSRAGLLGDAPGQPGSPPEAAAAGEAEGGGVRMVLRGKLRVDHNVFNEREEDAEAEGEGERVDEATDEGLEGLELDG